jgi:transcription elongation factor GreA-like protein
MTLKDSDVYKNLIKRHPYTYERKSICLQRHMGQRLNATTDSYRRYQVKPQFLYNF